MTDIKTYCADCGNETAGGTRCKTCHGKFLALEALKSTAVQDRQLLHEVTTENLSGWRVAKRRGVTRVRGWQMIKRAKEREEKRQQLGI